MILLLWLGFLGTAKDLQTPHTWLQSALEKSLVLLEYTIWCFSSFLSLLWHIFFNLFFLYYFYWFCFRAKCNKGGSCWRSIRWLCPALCMHFLCSYNWFVLRFVLSSNFAILFGMFPCNFICCFQNFGYLLLCVKPINLISIKS